MDWKIIPSLAALRAFEAAARTGSLSAAGRELNVTHAAIAQHVRTLEGHFGRALLERDGQRMATTEAGAALAEGLGEGFGQIAEAVGAVLDLDRSRPLRLALTPAFAANWLMPRLGRFWEAHPGVELELIPAAGLADLRRDAIDLAIRYGRGGWPGVESELLMPAGHVAVAAPGLIGDQTVSCLEDLRGLRWLMDGNRPEERLWLAANGIDLAEEQTTSFPTAQLAREAARAGLGITVLPEPVLKDDIDSGALVALCRERESSLSYHLVTRPAARSPDLTRLIRWLKAEAAG